MYVKKILSKFEQQEKYNADKDSNLVTSSNDHLGTINNNSTEVGKI